MRKRAATLAGAAALPVLLLLLALLLGPAAARAEQYVVFPEVGVGVGRTFFKDSSRPVAHLGLHAGGLFDRSELWGVGWLVQLGYLDTNSGRVPYPWSRVLLSPMACASLGYEPYSPFVRVAAGPQLTVSWRRSTRQTDVGGGVAGELALGFKDAVELFAQAGVAGDRHGPSFSLTGGVRLNVLVAVYLVSLFGGHGGDFALPPRQSAKGSRGPHPAEPVRPVHPAEPVR